MAGRLLFVTHFVATTLQRRWVSTRASQTSFA
jgi:hypothetical protein